MVFRTVVVYYILLLLAGCIFAAALDLSEVFDRLNQSQLILKLIEIRVIADIVILFTSWFKVSLWYCC